MLKVGEVVTMVNPYTSNQLGGTEKLNGTFTAVIVKAWEDYETGCRYIGELLKEEEIEISREAGKTSFPPEHYRQYGEERYLEKKERFDNYNPKKVYFGEFDKIERV